MLKMKAMAIYVLFFITLRLIGQNDTIQLRNKNALIGEIKSLSKGVLVIETSYSDKDFNVEFNKIATLVIQRKCLVILTEGRRRFGHIRTDSEGMAEIELEDGTKEHFKLEEVVAIEDVADNFWDRFNGSIDFSFTLSKANSLTQFVTGAHLNYVDNHWLVNGDMSLLNSQQDNTERTKRTDAQIELYRLLLRKWYIIGNLSFLANTEQLLEGRFRPSLGIGKFLVSTNRSSLGLSLGYAFSVEDYVDTSLNKTSSEAFLRASFDMFDFNDIDLDTTINLSPSLSEKGRLRADYDLNIKYDLPLDFYFKLGFILNYDNQPATGGNEVDYVLTTGIGWEFD